MATNAGGCGEELLRLENVHAYYQSGDTVVVGIQKVNLKFERGEFVLITGESGSGKSTLLNVISALHPYQDGEMYLNGQPTLWYDENDWEDYRRRHIGFVFQDYRLIESYTALQNVMAPLLLMGVAQRDAKAQAKAWIERVGLSGLENRRAAKMSSGQKQRLSVARALAKNTDIIVADEPTGNLDSENGRQIVELLSTLANDRLVIMVSHNVAEAEPFISRRVRLHDGLVASDERVRETPCAPPDFPEPPPDIDVKALARRVAAFNRRAQPKKAALITGFMALATVSCFLFLTTFLANMDDTPTRIYDDTAFKNGDPTRIVVRRLDGAEITEADAGFFRSIQRVAAVDRFDYVNDCSYYWREDVDYHIKVSVVDIREGAEFVGTKTETTILFLKNDNFMRTAGCLTEGDLAAGTLPESVNGVVLYGDASLIGTKLAVYFRDTRAWGAGDFLGLDMTVTGVLKEPSSQLYFSSDLARAMQINGAGYNRTLWYQHIPIPGAKGTWSYFIPLTFPDATLEKGASAFSEKFSDSLESLGPDVCFVRVENGVAAEEQWLTLTRLDRCSALVVKVAPDNFVWGDTVSTQASLYIEDYAYADDVLRALSATGVYEAASPYRAGALKHDEQKVKVNLATLSVSAIAFVLTPFLEALILLSILKFTLKDHRVMRSLGMSRAVMRRINRGELGFYAVLAVPIAALLAVLLTVFSGLKAFTTIMLYYRWYHTLILLIWHAAAASLLILWYNRWLVRHVHGKEELL
ncbi:MAG: ABC transporter ATP-binding protein/permease [Clostridiaceae bacterium]|nr:ABC transporter ATP-binding protein/permease [Eubacteriales bacterium]